MLDALPDDARLWLFAFDGDPAPLLPEVQAFCAAWTSHGRPVEARADALADRVLAVAAVLSPDEVNAGVSGCGIDALQRTVEQIASAHHLAFAPALDVTFRGADGAWTSASRGSVRARAADGAFGPETRVLDLTPTTLGALRAAGGADRPAGETWLAASVRLAV